MIVFPKRMLPALLASALPFAVQAMEGHGQGGQGGQGQWQQQQQCEPPVVIDKPCHDGPWSSCVQVQSVVTYRINSQGKVIKENWDTLDCQLTKHLVDGNSGDNCYPADKVCPPDVDQGACQNSHNQDGGQLQCYPLTSQPLESTWRIKARATQTGNAQWTHYTKAELTVKNGDSCIENLPCKTITQEEFFDGINGELARCLTLDDAKCAVSKLLAELAKNGKITYVDGKRVSNLQGGQGGQLSAGSKIIDKKSTQTVVPPKRNK